MFPRNFRVHLGAATFNVQATASDALNLPNDGCRAFHHPACQSRYVFFFRRERGKKTLLDLYAQCGIFFGQKCHQWSYSSFWSSFPENDHSHIWTRVCCLLRCIVESQGHNSPLGLNGQSITKVSWNQDGSGSGHILKSGLKVIFHHIPIIYQLAKYESCVPRKLPMPRDLGRPRVNIFLWKSVTQQFLFFLDKSTYRPTLRFNVSHKGFIRLQNKTGSE